MCLKKEKEKKMFFTCYQVSLLNLDNNLLLDQHLQDQLQFHFHFLLLLLHHYLPQLFIDLFLILSNLNSNLKRKRKEKIKNFTTTIFNKSIFSKNIINFMKLLIHNIIQILV